MNKIKVELLIEPTIDPRELIGGLARLTQFKSEFKLANKDRGESILKAIKAMGHTSLLEPVRFGFIISNASRVFLAQITRHRQATYVSQSQQYQDHSGFPYVVIPDLQENKSLEGRYHDLMQQASELYIDLKAAGIPQDQARYVIPGAARNDLFIETNARELINVIFPQRSCRRNTLETRVIISKMYNELALKGYSYLFDGVGPACLTTGICDQGKMACGRPFKSKEELELEQFETESLCK